MRIDILTVFPEMFEGPMTESILKRAQEAGILQVALHDIRDYATDRHQSTDDSPYGGGAGMVMRPEPVAQAIEAVKAGIAGAGPVIAMTPGGRVFTQAVAESLAREGQFTLLCGHYEGFDERVWKLVDDELSIGDYVLTGGELPAAVVVDTVARLVPGVLGDETSAQEESFGEGLLEYPQYTRPAVWRGWAVPEVLLSGNHAAIARWRRKEALRRTLERRPDLLAGRRFTPEELELLEELAGEASE